MELAKGWLLTTRTAAVSSGQPSNPGRSGETVMASPKTFWRVLCMLRVGWCLLPQTGYLHPDEFFQSPEVMAGSILDLKVYHPWEFLPKSPCRTVVFPLITSGAAFWAIKALQHLGLSTSCITSYTLLVSPRLLLTIFSFILDYSVYQLAPLWGADPWNSLALLAGSYVTLVFYTRTFANTVEGLLFALLLLLVSSKAASKTSASAYRWQNPLNHRLIGMIIVAGFFNRPTFLAFALVPLLHWVCAGATCQQSVRRTIHHVLCLAPSAAFTAVFFIAADTWYFTSPLSGLSLHSFYEASPLSILARLRQSVVVTPLNFLTYNLNPDNLAQHGTHPHLTHFAVNGVLLFGILHVEAVSNGIKLLKVHVSQFMWLKALKRSSHSAITCPEGRLALLAFYFIPLALLSLFSHQEPRFLIPLILPLVLLVTQHRQAQQWKSINLVFNLCGALFFGCFHQGGIVPCLFHLEQLTHSPESLSHRTHYTLLFARTYMPPRFLLNVNKSNTLVELVDMAGAEKGFLCQILGSIVNGPACVNRELGKEMTCQVLVIIPGTVRTIIEQCPLLVKKETVIFPHLTMEDPPQMSFLLSEKWRSQLGLHILYLERNKKSI
ncbi:GPI mannosyltransferase 4 isoform X2 [Podarcis raffonei]|uniref:GPI mannosyltransferase 4 isoform X2 n=1 Tax=Podarcis raffonei TaxID=65483 RepID=UPI00232931AF|nr:GPI mannosyltransferase 4 isoform X2 [Podarcis raffonei]